MLRPSLPLVVDELLLLFLLILDNMNSLISSSLCNYYILKVPLTPTRLESRYYFGNTQLPTKNFKISANANEVDTQATVEESKKDLKLEEEAKEARKVSAPALDKDLKKVSWNCLFFFLLILIEPISFDLYFTCINRRFKRLQLRLHRELRLPQKILQYQGLPCIQFLRFKGMSPCW